MTPPSMFAVCAYMHESLIDVNHLRLYQALMILQATAVKCQLDIERERFKPKEMHISSADT